MCHENVETLITHLIILLSDKCKKKLKKQINNLVYRLPLELLDFCRYLETDNVLFLRTPPSRNSKKKKTRANQTPNIHREQTRLSLRSQATVRLILHYQAECCAVSRAIASFVAPIVTIRDRTVVAS